MAACKSEMADGTLSIDVTGNGDENDCQSCCKRWCPIWIADGGVIIYEDDKILPDYSIDDDEFELTFLTLPLLHAVFPRRLPTVLFGQGSSVLQKPSFDLVKEVE